MRFVLLALVLAGALAVGVVTMADGDDTHDVNGALVLADPDHIHKLGRYCVGEREHGNLRRETAITVRDENDRIIATGTTSTGVQGDNDCAFPFQLDDVPDVAEYRFEVDDTLLATVIRADFNQADWTIKISVEDVP